MTARHKTIETPVTATAELTVEYLHQIGILYIGYADGGTLAQLGQAAVGSMTEDAPEGHVFIPPMRDLLPGIVETLTKAKIIKPVKGVYDRKAGGAVMLARVLL